jgi:predicted RNase H-like HicB family nuclease
MIELHLTAVIRRERGSYTARCPELDIHSEGKTAEHARDNLTRAVEAFLQTADTREIHQRINRRAS